MSGFYPTFGKRLFDFILATLGLCLTWWVIVIAIIVASIDTRSFGLFMQHRVGQGGRIFTIFKIKTMRPRDNVTTTITTTNDIRLTNVGKWLRRMKIDELPQLINVLLGQMSFVGPRPDVLGWADQLQGDDRAVLTLRPGITGPATLEFRDEEAQLAQVVNPEAYNRDVIFPRKTQLNLAYAQNQSLIGDIGYILETIIPSK